MHYESLIAVDIKEPILRVKTISAIDSHSVCVGAGREAEDVEQKRCSLSHLSLGSRLPHLSPALRLWLCALGLIA